jgi:hypothetical protein
MRFGLAGTGHWAASAHAPALAASSADGIEFTSVWGRNPAAAAGLAARYQATPYQDFGRFLASVDAVDFAVPPDVQAPLATQAAQAGKHLLLEKPIALTGPAADELATAVSQAQVASVVFFTARFQPDVRAWLDEVAAAGGWAGGQALWLGTAMQPGSPFNTPWRQAKGALWDLAPHAALGDARPGHRGHRGSRAGRRHAPDPAARGRRVGGGDGHAQRAGERRGLPAGAVGTGGPVGGPGGDRPAHRAAAHRPGRAGRQRPDRSAQPPLRRPVRPGRRPGPG